MDEEGHKIVKFESVRLKRKKTREAPANFVPAAAVIRREQVLFEKTGCKGFVGGDRIQ